MNAGLLAAGVGLISAFVGGLLTALSTRNVEAMRVRAALVEKAEERKLVSIERFLLAVNAWLDWLIYMEEQPSPDLFDELNTRVKARDDSYRQLILLASDPLHEWLIGDYNQLEYALKQTYAREVRNLRRPDAAAIELRRRFSDVVRGEMIARLRPEVAALRDPVSREHRLPHQRH